MATFSGSDPLAPADLVSLGLLTGIASRIAAGDPTEQIFESIIRGAESERPGVICSILLLKEERWLSLGAAPHLPRFYSDAINGVVIGPSVGSCGTAAFLKQRVIVTDIASDPLWVDFKDLAASAGLAACWSEPIIGAQGRVLGAFAMYQTVPAAPSDAEIDLIAAAAYLAAITIERDQVKDALAESEARAHRAAAGEQALARDLETLFNVSSDLFCVSNLAGEYVRVNQAWKTVLGYNPEDLIGRLGLPLVHPDDRSATIAKVGELAGAAAKVLLINRVLCADGGYKPIEWRGSLSGETLFYIGRDVTERVAAEAEMKAARLAAEAANQAKSDFLANMSHEVRTPLNGVIGIVDALSRTPLTPAQREMVELIQTSGDTLERLVSDILDVSKIEAGRLELELREFDLGEALDSVLDVARIRADDKGVQFTAAYGVSARGRFRGDSVRLKQIVDNLLSNAVKFTQAGQVSVEIDLVEPAEDERPARLTVAVCDTGIGFDPAVTASLFDRFSQADGAITRRYGGSGLGLSICKALAEMLGGQITASSQPGLGSRFGLEIPLPRTVTLAAYDLARGAHAQPGSSEAEPREGEARDLRVLLAEDNQTNQKVVSLILAPLGVHLTVVENGALAVEAFQNQEFDLVLMDMQMPVMDGLAATRALRAIERAMPERRRTAIAMLSANAMPHHCDEAEAAGADLHIAKPVTARGLIEGVQQALSAGEAAEAA